MRIGFDGRLPFHRMGGIGQYILNLIPALAALDPDDEYVVLQASGDPRSLVPPGAGNVRRHDVVTPSHHRLERLTLPVELAGCGLDVLHSPDVVPPPSGATRRVITVHDIWFVQHPEHLAPDGRRHYVDQVRWAVESADHVIADSDFTRREVCEVLGAPPQKVTTVHLAPAIPIHAGADRAAITATLDRLHLAPGFVLFVGTLEPRKNVGTLLRAVAQLSNTRHARVPLVLVGRRGWLCDDVLDQMARMRPASDVRWLPDLPDRDVAHLYAAAGLLALPSLCEGFGLPVLEAMASGCPVVTSDRGALPEIAGSAAVHLEAEDAEAWARTLARMLEDEAWRRELIAAGRARAADFSWAKTAAGTLRVYRAVS